MKESLLFLFIGIGLSMDAFSLAVVYGTNNLEKKKCLILSIIVGIFHFIMPNLGSILSNKLLTNFATYGNIITGIVFLVLGIQMILSLNDEEKTTDLSNYLEIIMFAIAVSIDNLTSSQSTIRDADIAEVSSEYIRNQILQQASATLLATANQSPSFALQLI